MNSKTTRNKNDTVVKREMKQAFQQLLDGSCKPATYWRVLDFVATKCPDSAVVADVKRVVAERRGSLWKAVSTTTTTTTATPEVLKKRKAAHE